MSKVLGTVGTVAGIVATVASFANPATAVLGVAVGTIARVATAVAVISSLGAQLTAPKPVARGSLTNILIGAEGPIQCVVGRSYIGGQLLLDVGYGGKVGKVQNPYSLMVVDYGLGPAQSIEALQLDFNSIAFSGTAATGYYANFLWASRQLGARPESAALAPQFAGAPGWGASSKLSGHVAVAWSAKFDEKGERWASGIPQLGIIQNGPACYDPRLDSTLPGGSGTCRATDETTWVFSNNPAVQCATYILGRRHNGLLLFGVGDAPDSIDWPRFMAWANVCDANGWHANGVLVENGDEGERNANIKRLCAAGGAQRVFNGALWSVAFEAPGVALDTITKDDLADGFSFDAMRFSRDRPNTITPRVLSEAHRWQMVSTTSAASIAEYVTQDGEKRAREVDYELVTDPVQAIQLATYELMGGRELGPIDIVCKPRLRGYGPGTRLTLHVPEEGIDNLPVKVLARVVDPATMSVRFTVVGETAGKDAYALGRTTTLPPAAGLVAPQDADAAQPVANTATGLTLDLDNPSAVLPALSDGTVTSYAPAVGNFVVYDGSTEVSTSFNLVAADNPQGLTYTVTGRHFEVTGGFDPGEETAYITWRLEGTGTYLGRAIDRRFNLTKSKAGVGSAASRLISIAADRRTITFDASGNPSPAVQTITLTATRQNTTAATTWAVYDANGVAKTPVTDYLSAATGDSVSMTVAQFNAARGTTNGVRFAGSINDGLVITDTVDAFRVQNGAPGLNGQNGASAFNLANVANTSFPAPGLVQKSGGGTGWTGKARTVESGPAASISAPAKASTGIGLSRNPASTSDYSDADAWLHAGGDGKLYRYVMNVGLVDTGFTWTGTDRLRVSINGTTAALYRNGTQIISYPVMAGDYAGIVNLFFDGDQLPATAFSLDGAPGDDGQEGQSYGAIYQRSATEPATPGNQPGTPAGWYDSTGAVPDGSAILWKSAWTRAPGAVNRVYQRPTRDEAITAVNSGASVALGFTVSQILSFSLLPGQSRVVTGSGNLPTPTGSGTAYVQIEWRTEGGTWQASNGPAFAYAATEPATPDHAITVANSSALTVGYEVRGTIVRSNANSGPADPATSRLVI